MNDLIRRQTDGASLPIIPDCCNLGTILRVMGIMAVLLLIAAGVVIESSTWTLKAYVAKAGVMAAVGVPATLIIMALLCPLRKLVNGREHWRQWALGLSVTMIVTFFCVGIQSYAFEPNVGHPFLTALPITLLSALMAAGFFEWLRLRQIALQPSQAEGRLQALQARIRPHFLFNSLNTVLGLMRSDPRRAEKTLENLADLFRVFMRDSRELVPLDEEILLCKEYLAIEKLRLSDRLDVMWAIDDMPGDALLPSLLLQPLVENAVHHGIEPRMDTGTVLISISKPGDKVRVEISNPLPEPDPNNTAKKRPSNNMALSNVQERLALTFDVEASIQYGPEDGQFRVLVQFPYKKERRQRDVRSNHHPDR
jgi:two-component system, LytTR family, sensor histidine kinase AlgZ